MSKSGILKNLLNSDETLIIPDAYDPISAKLIENTGFKAVQCSGYSFSIAAGYKKEIDVSLDENIEWTHRIVESVNIPVMADAEDGYGSPEEVINTLERFMQIGVAGVNLEDQIPNGKKKVSVVDSDLMEQKIIVARETADVMDNPDFIINARTDALRSTVDRSTGLELAIDRANQYLETGADIAFITYVETLDEVKTITQEVKGPISIAAGLHYNIENFSINDLKKYGVTRISLPTLLIFTCLGALKNSLDFIKKDNMLKAARNGFLYPVQDLNSLL